MKYCQKKQTLGLSVQLFPLLHRGFNLCVSFEANIVAYFQHPILTNIEVTSNINIKLWISSLPKCGQKCIFGANIAVFGPNCPEAYPEPKTAPEMSEGGQIWRKCITGDLSKIIRYKKNMFERVKKSHPD